MGYCVTVGEARQWWRIYMRVCMWYVAKNNCHPPCCTLHFRCHFLACFACMWTNCVPKVWFINRTVDIWDRKCVHVSTHCNVTEIVYIFGSEMMVAAMVATVSFTILSNSSHCRWQLPIPSPCYQLQNREESETAREKGEREGREYENYLNVWMQIKRTDATEFRNIY